jgi:hypothetical protein
LYILKYLMFAEKRHPDVYQGILNNKTWCVTFLEVDRNVSDLLQSYSGAKPAIFRRLAGYGWTVSEDANTLAITSDGRTVRHINFEDVVALLSEEMKKPEYLAVLRTVKEHAEGWNPDAVYDEVALAMKETRYKDTQGGTPETKIPRQANRRPLEDVAVLSDPPGDADHPFIDMVGAEASMDGDGLVVRMKLREFPDRLTFCQPDVPENRQEYRWSVVFDADGDGNDDFSIELTNFKAPESEPVKGDPLKIAQLTLWELSDQGGQASDAVVRGGRIGNELVFEVPMCGPVSSIGPNTRVHFETYYTDGGTEDQDSMPD